MNDMRVNTLPSPTWKWLKMNYADVKDVQEAQACSPQVEIPAGSPAVVGRTDAAVYKEYRTGVGYDMVKLVDTAGDLAYEVAAEAGQKADKPVVLRMDFDADKSEAIRVVLRAEEGSELTVIMVYRSEKEAAGQAAVQTYLDVKKNAKINLIQIDVLGKGFRFFNDIGGRLEDKGQTDMTNIILGGKEIYEGCSVDLAGRESSLEADIGYFIGNTVKLDMNYEAVHHGKKSECRMDANGVLRDKAEKLFRGTIDFRDGCAGSVGNEKEDVLMFEDGVINRTIPLILCVEEDVEGNHGATIGKLDNDLLFYMESRGIDEQSAYRAIADARLRSLCRKIPDSAIRCRTENYFESGTVECE